MPPLDPEMSYKIGTLQMLDDAITYRLDRLNPPCSGCGPGGRCTEHSHDEELVTGYMDRYAAAFSEVVADLNPGDFELMMRPGDSMPPTVSALGNAVMTRLREFAATGPVVVNVDGRMVIIEQDGPVVAEYSPGACGFAAYPSSGRS